MSKISTKHPKQKIFDASNIGIGTWGIGGNSYGVKPIDCPVAIIKKSIDLGLNFIDTANVYGFGYAEEVIAKATKGIRDKIIISTKFGLHWTSSGEVHKDNSPKMIEASIHASLKRLGTDYIDIYNIHWPDQKTKLEDIISKLESLRQKGLINKIGCSNFSLPSISEYVHKNQIDVIQLPANLIEYHTLQEANELFSDAFPKVGFNTFGRGLLLGGYNFDTCFKAGDTRERMKVQNPDTYRRYISAGKEIRSFCSDYDLKPEVMLLKQSLNAIGLQSVILNFMKLEDLNIISMANETKIPKHVFDEFAKLTAKLAKSAIQT